MSDVSENEDENILEQKQKKQQYTNATRDVSTRFKKQKKDPKTEVDMDQKSDEEFEYESDEEYYKRFLNQESDQEDELKRQLRLEKEETERKTKENEKKTRRDPDGTEYEWDPVIKGWFPVFSDRQLIDFQQHYNTQSQVSQSTPSHINAKLLENTFYLFNGAFYKWDFNDNKWTPADSPVYSYVDYMTGISYEWNQEANKWEAKGQQYTTGYKPPDAGEASKNINKEKKKRDGWFEMEDEKNTNVYVSGLPLDITDEEFETLMSKYGIIMKDPITHKLKIKLYRENDEVKGDGRCCFLMPESVKLCLQLLDDSMYREHKIKVEKAKFEQKGTFDPSKAKILTESQKKKLSKAKEKKLLDKQRQKLLDWEERPEIVRQKHEKVVVIKNIFSPSDFERKKGILSKFKDDLKSELEVYGDVKKILIHDRNEEGVITVSFKNVEMADTCCEYLNNRVWKNGRIITCETWDGSTKYEVEETEEERQRRIDEWHKFLEEEAEEED